VAVLWEEAVAAFLYFFRFRVSRNRRILRRFPLGTEVVAAQRVDECGSVNVEAEAERLGMGTAEWTEWVNLERAFTAKMEGLEVQ